MRSGADRPGTDLERLEHSLLGGAGEGLSLKARLERLVAAAARARPRRPAAAPLEDLVVGKRVENDRGEYFLVEEDLHLDSRHGEVPFSRFRALLPGSVAIVSGEPDLHSFDLCRAVFLDTETTGLAGGAGTAAFLVGIGFVAGDRFLVRQYLMRDYHEEAALLRGLAAELASFPFLVTYNGKAFDMPLLESRFRLNREAFPIPDAQHLDLLAPARRLWKLRLSSCRLQSLETALLGVRRTGDVPGEEIPRIYFDYIRSRDARGIARVLEHNRLDVLSLAALTAFACQWVNDAGTDAGPHGGPQGGPHLGPQLGPEDPRDAYSLGRVLERAQLYERSEVQYRRCATMPDDEGPLRVAALLRLASRAKKAGDHASARGLWEEAAAGGSWLAFRELAVYHEHRSRDLSAALDVVDRGLGCVEDAWDPAVRKAAGDFVRRRARLERKLAACVRHSTN